MEAIAADAAKQAKFYAVPIQRGQFQITQYSAKASTSEIIRCIQGVTQTTDFSEQQQSKQQQQQEEEEEEESSKEKEGDGETEERQSIIQQQQQQQQQQQKKNTRPPSSSCTANKASAQPNVSNTKPGWFGSTVTQANGGAAHIPYDPFPLSLRVAVSNIYMTD